MVIFDSEAQDLTSSLLNPRVILVNEPAQVVDREGLDTELCEGPFGLPQ